MTHTSQPIPAPSARGADPGREQAITDLRRENEQLRDAMSSRAAIEQAKGMLMLGYDLRADQAFAVLTRWSQAHNVKVRTLAEDMTSHPLTALTEPGTSVIPLAAGEPGGHR